MKVAVSSSGRDLNSQIDPRFGRCAYFLIIETQDMTFEVFENENIALGGGAGIQSAQFVASKGAKTVITGNCGPNAVRTLSAAGVELFVGQTGTMRDVIERYKNGELSPTTEANVSDHYGTGAGGPMGDTRAQGLGGGVGTGRGMGMGRGMDRGMGMGPGIMPQAAPQAMSPEQEIEMLKSQVQMLSQQLNEIQRRLEELEKGS